MGFSLENKREDDISPEVAAHCLQSDSGHRVSYFRVSSRRPGPDRVFNVVIYGVTIPL